MEIRPMKPADIPLLAEIDGMLESMQYLHVERAGEGLSLSLAVEPRPLRIKLFERNAIDDDRLFTYRQIATGADEGTALVIDHDDLPIASAVAVPRPAAQTLEIVDLRVDSDHRR